MWNSHWDRTGSCDELSALRSRLFCPPQSLARAGLYSAPAVDHQPESTSTSCQQFSDLRAAHCRELTLINMHYLYQSRKAQNIHYQLCRPVLYSLHLVAWFVGRPWTRTFSYYRLQKPYSLVVVAVVVDFLIVYSFWVWIVMAVKPRETGRVSFLKIWSRFLRTSIVTFPLYQYLPLRASCWHSRSPNDVHVPSFISLFVNSCSSTFTVRLINLRQWPSLRMFSSLWWHWRLVIKLLEKIKAYLLTFIEDLTV